MENISLIDVSLEDDLLIADDDDTLSDLPSLENHEPRKVSFLLESANTHEGWNPGKMNKQLEQTPEFSESPELKHAKSGVVNLRKSLAWDSAFFTSEGVLNTEELAIVNGTFRKAESCKLPGIQEELRKSSESTSTLDSESYALENLELDMFGNIRASIQMSLGKCDKAFGGPDALHPGSLEKIDISNKMKPPVNLKRGGTCKQQLHSTPKEAIIGVNSAVKGIVDSKSSSRPPRIMPKMSTVPRSKVAAGSIQLKDHTKKLSSGIGVNRQNFVAFDRTQGNSCGVTSRTNASAKPTRGSQPGTVVFSNTSSSHQAGKSPLELTRKRTASRNGDHSLSTSTNKTPLRNSKSRLAPPNSKSTRGSSSRVSPHSSIDSSFSESSSSASTTIKRSNSVESLDASSTSSSHSVAVPSDVDSSTIGKACVRKVTSVTLSQSQYIIKSSEGPHALPEPLTRDHSRSINNNTGSKPFKPSGLRMPSPKIGYFDAEKTLDRSSNKFPQTSMVKNTTETSNTAGANKLKSSKIPSIKPPALSITHQDSKPAELHRDSVPITSENDRNPVSVSEGVAEVMLPALSAATHSENKSAVLGGHPDVTYQIPKLDAQDGHIENILLVTDKCEKENLFPAYGVTRDFSTENQKMLMVDMMEKKLSSLSLS